MRRLTWFERCKGSDSELKIQANQGKTKMNLLFVSCHGSQSFLVKVRAIYEEIGSLMPSFHRPF